MGKLINEIKKSVAELDGKPYGIFDNIKYYAKNVYWDITHPFTNFYYNVKRVLIWIPQIWKDREWDYWFMWDIFQFKLKRMESYHRNSNILEENEKRADEIQIAIDMIQILQDNNFVEKEQDEYFEKYPLRFAKMKKTENGCFQMEEISDEQRTEMHKLNLLEDSRKKEHIDKLFEYLKNNYEKWWD